MNNATFWPSVAAIVGSLSTLIAVLIGNRRGSVIEQKTDAVKNSVTTPATDSRTLAEIASELHPEQDSV